MDLEIVIRNSCETAMFCGLSLFWCFSTLENVISNFFHSEFTSVK